MTSDVDDGRPKDKTLLPPDKMAALRARLARARSQLHDPVIPAVPPGQRVRASFAQERMWFNARTSQTHAAYNSQVALHLNGPLDLASLSRSLEEIRKRHDVCNLALVEDGGIVWQEVASQQNDALSIIDLPDAPDDEVRRTVNALVTRPFDLRHGPLVRWTLIRLSTERNVLVFSDHHSATDGWSRQIVFDELMKLYGHFVFGGTAANLPENRLGYRDFANWQRAWSESEEGQKQISFWKMKLQDTPSGLELPSDFVRPSSPSYRGGHLLQKIDRALMDALGEVGAATGSTNFMVFFAAFIVLLHRLTGAEDISIGTGVANRRMEDTDAIVGMLINTVVLRARPVPGMRFLDLLRQIKDLSLEAFANQEAPFDRVVQAVNPVRSSAINPLHQITFNFQNNPMPDVKLPGLETRLERPLFNGSAKYDLYVAGWPQDGERLGNWMSDASAVLLSWEFSLDLFTEESIRRMQAQYGEVLKKIAADRNAIIDDIGLEAGDAARASEPDFGVANWGRVHDLVAAQARRTPKAIAVQCGAETLTYEDVDSMASGLAGHLVSIGQAGATIGVAARRSIRLPIGLTGILKAGGSYMPLDPELPASALREMIATAAITHVLCDEGDRLLFEELGLSVLVHGEHHSGNQAALPDVPESALAYVMFTSGSTGRPKAVAVPHRAVARLVCGQSFVDMGPDRTWLLHSPLSFDATTLEIWAPLCNGGRLVIQPDGPYSLRELGETIRQHRVDSLWITAGLFQLAASDCPEIFSPLSQLLTGGDVVSPDAVRRVMQVCPATRIVNGYGPTENTTFTCCGEIRADDLDRRSIPIGVPIRGTTVFVLDHRMRRCPPGRIGELFAGGAGLANGYLGDARATAERFVDHPELGRLYRTGDLCRVLPDGRIEFAGRRDRQVKISGYRIELAEVEARVSSLPGVSAVAVAAMESQARGAFLRAVVVLDGGSSRQDFARLKTAARAVLPAYQLPAEWFLLTELPVTPNGKIDIAAIQQLAPDQGKLPDRPQDSAMELRIAAIFQEVLGHPVDDHALDFFSLGGDSLGALRALSLLESAFGVELSASLFFGDSSITNIARTVVDVLRNRRMTGSRHPRLPLIQPGPGYPALVLVPGGWGEENELLVFARLVRTMRTDAAKFGVRSGVTDGRTGLAENMHEHARELADILAAELDPRHVVIVGECAASTVALALVKELSGRGTPVLGLVLLDPGEPAHLRNVVGRVSLPKGSQPPVISTLPPKVAGYYHLLAELPDGPIDVPLRIVLSQRFANADEIARQWTAYAGREVPLTLVPGDHNSYLREQADDTARAMDMIVSSLAGL